MPTRRLLGRELPVWQVNLYVLVLVVFTAFVGFNFASPFLPLYVRELGVADPAAVAIWSGAILAVAPFASAFASPLWGTLADRLGRRRLLMQTVCGFGLLSALMALANSAPQLFFLRLGMGLVGGFTSIVIALASMVPPPERMSRSVGMVQSAQLLSLAIGPALGGLVADHFGLRATFLVTTGLSAVAAGVLWLLFEEPTPAHLADETPAVSAKASSNRRALFTLPLFLPLLLILFLAQFVDRILAPLIPLLVSALPVAPNATAGTAGFIIAAGAVAAAISASLFGRLAERWRHARLLLVAFLLGAAGCMAMAAVTQAWELGLLRIGVGLAAGGTLTLAYAQAGAVIPAEQKAAAFGLLTSAVMIGGAISPLAGGFLAAWSLRGAFLIVGTIALLGVGVILCGLRETAVQPTPGPTRNSPWLRSLLAALRAGQKEPGHKP